MFKTIKLIFAQPSSRIAATVFLALSAGLGAWYTRLPEIKASLDLSEAELGASLFFIPLGSATLLPFYSKIIGKLGDKKAIIISCLFFLALVSVPGMMTTQWHFMVSLYFLGLAIGLTDVSMNAEVTAIEKQFGVVIMSGCHGFFSLGGMFGALFGSLMIYLDISVTYQMVLLGVVLVLIMIPQFKHLINADEPEDHGSLTLPPRQVLVFAIIGLCIMMSEGGISEWSAIFLKEDLTVAGEYAGLGFAGFSLLMALGRFYGDGLGLKYGSKSLVLVGSGLAVAGLALVLVQSPIAAIVGFSIAGLGYSVIVPILFSSAAKVDGIRASRGIAAVASSGYIGMLTGPVVIGFVAEEFGLSNGFLFLLILTLIGLLLSFKAFK